MPILYLLFASILMSIMTANTSLFSIGALQSSVAQKENLEMIEISRAVIAYYDDKGVMPTDASQLVGYISGLSLGGDEDILKDNMGAWYVILSDTNSNQPFTHNGGAYRFVVVSPGSDGVQAKIESGTLFTIKNEAFFLISESSFKKYSLREKTKEKIAQCNNAVSLFHNAQIAKGAPNTLPSSVASLVSDEYVKGKDVIDGFGNIMGITASGQCYSFGPNGVDENGGGDDIQ